MNERIRQLAEHCDFYVGNEHYNESHEEKQRLWVEKFGELIVRECAKAADEGLAQVTMKVEWPSYHIKKHFGVEE
jgi:hypothetical protein